MIPAFQRNPWGWKCPQHPKPYSQGPHNSTFCRSCGSMKLHSFGEKQNGWITCTHDGRNHIPLCTYLNQAVNRVSQPIQHYLECNWRYLDENTCTCRGAGAFVDAITAYQSLYYTHYSESIEKRVDDDSAIPPLHHWTIFSVQHRSPDRRNKIFQRGYSFGGAEGSCPDFYCCW